MIRKLTRHTPRVHTHLRRLCHASIDNVVELRVKVLGHELRKQSRNGRSLLGRLQDGRASRCYGTDLRSISTPQTAASN